MYVCSYIYICAHIPKYLLQQFELYTPQCAPAELSVDASKRERPQTLPMSWCHKLYNVHANIRATLLRLGCVH
jgi:hypothetical protein